MTKITDRSQLVLNTPCHVDYRILRPGDVFDCTFSLSPTAPPYGNSLGLVVDGQATEDRQPLHAAGQKSGWKLSILCQYIIYLRHLADQPPTSGVAPLSQEPPMLTFIATVIVPAKGETPAEILLNAEIYQATSAMALRNRLISDVARMDAPVDIEDIEVQIQQMSLTKV